LAGPYEKIQEMLETFQQQMRQEIQEALKQTSQQPAQTSTTTQPPQDINALREELMEQLKLEMLTMKQEIAKMMLATQQQTPQQAMLYRPPEKTKFIDRFLANYEDAKYENDPRYRELPLVCPEPYPRSDFRAQVAWQDKWDRWYKIDNTRKKKYAKVEEIAYLLNQQY
jgi:hypothetical protein